MLSEQFYNKWRFNPFTFEWDNIMQPEFINPQNLRKVNMQDVTQNTKTPTLAPDTRKVIGTNPDGTPIYEEAFVQTPAHTGTEAQ